MVVGPLVECKKLNYGGGNYNTISVSRIAGNGRKSRRLDAARRLNDQQRFLLGECVHAYLPLDAEQLRKFEGLLETESYAKVRAMNQTVYEKGRREGQLELICSLFEEHFGPGPADTRECLEQLPMDALGQVALKIPKVMSPAELGLQDASSCDHPGA